MPQQVDAVTPEDDWTGVTSTVERRRLQNRLNQRAYRQSFPFSRTTAVGVINADNSINCIGKRKLIQARHAPAGDITEQCHGRRSQGDSFSSPDCLVALPKTQEMLLRFSQEALEACAGGVPRLTSLSLVIQLNVFNALVHNGTILGIQAGTLCDKGLLSPFNHMGPFLITDSCPVSLRPTEIQKTAPHHPWIDLFPLPRMRDNFIVACHSIDEEELGNDVVGMSDCAFEKPTLITWGEPWDPRGWEVSAAFLRKWGWLLRGCGEIIDATNYWRERRGEKRLTIDLS